MKSKFVILFSCVIFITLLFIVPTSFISADLGSTILTLSTFLFGIIAGFYIVVTTTDYNNMKGYLAQEVSNFQLLYQSVKIYDKKSAKKLAEAIDTYVRRSFDYEIIDSARGALVEFENVQKTIIELPIKPVTLSVHQVILGALGNLNQVIQQATVLGTRTLSRFQWVVLFILGGIVTLSLYGLRTGEVFFDVVTVAVSTSIIIIYILIRELDLYIWNEKTFSFEIYQNVFRTIGKLPYYPTESIRKGRVRPGKGKYRLGTLIGSSTTKRKIETRGR